MMNGVAKRIIVSLLMMVLLVAAGCSSQNSSTDGDSEAPKEYAGIIPIYTPGAGGIAYILSAGISNVFNNSDAMPKVQLVTEATNGSADIMQFVLDRYKEGKPAFGGLAAETVSHLYEGNYSEIEGEHPELKAVGFLSMTALHVVVPANSDIQSFADLKGKKIGSSPGAATTSLLFQFLEEGYGLKAEDYKHIPIDYAEIQQGLQNGSIDAGLINGAIPAPLVKETESLMDIRVLSAESDRLDAFLEKYPYHSSRVVKAGTYKNQPEDVTVPALMIIYATHEKSSETLVYNFVRTILENQSDIVAIHPAGSNLTAETILDGVAIPLHPGAEKYYKEKGIIE